MSDGQSPVFLNPDEDPEMDAASYLARETFCFFWRELTWERHRIVPGLDSSAVKLAFSDEGSAPTDRPAVEHMWVNDVDYDGYFISGVLLNAPNWVQSVKQGDAVRVPMAHLGDWMYSQRSRAYGAFTVNLLRLRMGEAERKGHDDAWGLDFGDPSNVQIIPPPFVEPQKQGLFKRKKEAPPAAPVDLSAEHPMALNMAIKWGEQLDQQPHLVQQIDERGWTFTHTFALAGSAACVQALLDRGADPNALTPSGLSPAQLAHTLGWTEVVTLLQSRGGR